MMLIIIISRYRWHCTCATHTQPCLHVLEAVSIFWEGIGMHEALKVVCHWHIVSQLFTALAAQATETAALLL